MSKQAVYSWETGIYSPDISVLLKIADYFQIPICMLIGRPGMYCKGAELSEDACKSCTSITEMDSRILRAIHSLSPEKQTAITTLLGITPMND